MALKIPDVSIGTLFGMDMATAVKMMCFLQSILFLWDMIFTICIVQHMWAQVYMPFIQTDMFTWSRWVNWFAGVCVVVGTILTMSAPRDTQNKRQMSKLLLFFTVLYLLTSFVHGINFTKILRKYFDFPMEFLNKFSQKAPGRILKGLSQLLALAAGFMRPYIAQRIIQFVPSPVNAVFWLGWQIGVTIIVYIVLPLFVCALALYTTLGLNSIIQDGGDGTERVSYEDIELYYDTDPGERYKLDPDYREYDDDDYYYDEEEDGYAYDQSQAQAPQRSDSVRAPLVRGQIVRSGSSKPKPYATKVTASAFNSPKPAIEAPEVERKVTHIY